MSLLLRYITGKIPSSLHRYNIDDVSIVDNLFLKNGSCIFLYVALTVIF
jgi:hypothetical protein